MKLSLLKTWLAGRSQLADRNVKGEVKQGKVTVIG